MRLSFFIFSLVLVAACSSNGKKNDDITYEEDKVLGRSDGRSARPDWAKETISVGESDGKFQFIGLAEVPGDSRTTAAFKMSDASARGGVASKIETSVLKVVQTSDTGLKLEDQELKSLIQEVSSVSLKDVDVKDRYWEKVQRVNSDGQKLMVMKVFSLIEIEKSELKKMMLERTRSADAPVDMRNKVEDLIRNQWSPGPV